MKLVIDAIGAPADSGGMRLYTEEIVRCWNEPNGQDDLLVLGDKWITTAFENCPHVKTRTVRCSNGFSSTLARLMTVAVVFWQSRSQAVLSVSQVVTPLIPRRARFCVVHDWRHVRNPSEFSRIHVFYRRLWAASVKWSRKAFAISEKTKRETLELIPRSTVVLVENGRDHARRWCVDVQGSNEPSSPTIVTFGHHANKRPELVLEAFAHLVKLTKFAGQLVVLGARGELSSRLLERAEVLGLGRQLALPGFVEASIYQGLLARSVLVVLASSDEGFGLPVAEAQYFGIPVVCTNDSGLREIHGSAIIEAEPTPAALGAAMKNGLSQTVENKNTNSRPWAAVCRELREHILDATSVASHSRVPTCNSAGGRLQCQTSKRIELDWNR